MTTPVNAAGLPALALPVPAAGGPRAANGPLPASVQLIGPAGSEDRLLAAGLVLERRRCVLRNAPGRPEAGPGGDDGDRPGLRGD